MSSIFLSYKREDEVRAARLVQALEGEGLSVWWDKGLPGGEEWRANIERALAEARCVIVLWTRASVGPEGAFVRDEASRARDRGALVPVRAQRVAAPLGFGEIQTIDLAHWRGSRADPFFKDLVATVRSKLDGTKAPPAKGPVTRLYRRLVAGTTAGALLAAVFGFSMNAMNIQDQLCTEPLGQPVVSDICGGIGIGHRPTHDDRVAWETRSIGSCEALRSFASNERSYYHGIAADMLNAATSARAHDFTPASRDWRSYVRTGETPFENEASARADALGRAQTDAANQGCAPRDEFERLVRADVTPTGYDCRRDPRGGFGCALNYVARCQIERQQLVEQCR